jgi:hypothetical protein
VSERKYGHLSNWNTSVLTDMSNLFYSLFIRRISGGVEMAIIYVGKLLFNKSFGKLGCE